MKVNYIIIVNGYEQNTLMPFELKEYALKTIDEWKADGRLKETDKVVIKTTIIIEDEIKF